jgi:transposase-like protein
VPVVASPMCRVVASPMCRRGCVTYVSQELTKEQTSLTDHVWLNAFVVERAVYQERKSMKAKDQDRSKEKNQNLESGFFREPAFTPSFAPVSLRADSPGAVPAMNRMKPVFLAGSLTKTTRAHIRSEISNVANEVGERRDSMPLPSKFTTRRRAMIAAVLAAGGSGRQAAAAAGISHETLRQWLKRAEQGAPGGRWAAFREQVEAARTNPGLRLLEVADGPTDDEVIWAVRYLDSVGWDDPVRDVPQVIKLHFPSKKDVQ